MTYSVRRHWERYRVHQLHQGESLTEQSHAPSLEINTLIARHARAGGLPPVGGVFEDVTLLQAPLAERISFSERVLSEYAAEQAAAAAAASESSASRPEAPPPVDKSTSAP